MHTAISIAIHYSLPSAHSFLLSFLLRSNSTIRLPHCISQCPTFEKYRYPRVFAYGVRYLLSQIYLSKRIKHLGGNRFVCRNNKKYIAGGDRINLRSEDASQNKGATQQSKLCIALIFELYPSFIIVYISLMIFL